MGKFPDNACKYPRTPHLPWSPGATNDDRVLENTRHFLGKAVIVTEKMDGENTTLYKDYIHARSLDSPSHISQSLVRAIHAQIKHLIPPDLRICGENLYARHSIHYGNLPSTFMVFSIWEGDMCVSWKETEEWCRLLNLVTVPVIEAGIWDVDRVEQSCNDMSLLFNDPEGHEGFCIRRMMPYLLENHEMSTAKYVRENHVQTDEHWKKNWRDILEMRNQLKGETK